MSAFMGLRSGIARSMMRRLLLLDQPVPTQSDGEIAAEVERNYRWNFSVNLLDGVAFWFGISFVSSSTIIPLFVSKLTGDPLLIGLVAVIAQAGWFLPQLLTAGYTERLARKKPIVINLGLFTERLPVIAWPCAALLAPYSPGLALSLFLFTYAWHGVGAGAIGPAWQDMIAACFPVNRRGRFFGLTSFLGTGIGAVGAFLSSWILLNYAFPTNFSILFTIAAVSIIVSWFFLALTLEPVRPVTEVRRGKGHFRKKLRRILYRDINFRQYLTARMLMALGTMGLGFVTVAAVRRWGVPDSTVGLYTAVLLFGQTAGNLLAGLVADRHGHKLSLQVGGASGVLAFLLAWHAPAPVWYFAVFGFLGIYLGVSMVSGTLISMEFTQPAHRPSYIGMANTSMGLVNSVAPLIGGWIAGYSYSNLFAAGTVAMMCGLILLTLSVKEPRRQVFDLSQDAVLEASTG